MVVATHPHGMSRTSASDPVFRIRVVPPDPNTIALVSVIAGASTAIAVPLINASMQRGQDQRRFAHELELSRKAAEREQHQRDFQELRQLLDETDVALVKFIEAIGSMESRLHTAETTDIAHFTENLAGFHETRDALWPLSSRLHIRLSSDSEVLQALSHAQKVVGSSGAEAMAMITLEQAVSMPDLDTLGARRSEWYTARQDYLDATQNLVRSSVSVAAA
jgi:hypothetical protein